MRAASRWAARAKPRWHKCYANAGEFAVSHKNAAYYEGFWRYSADNDPVHHAWVVLGGEVIDFTAEDVDRRARRQGVALLPPGDQQYLGVYVPTDFVRRRVETCRVWGPASEAYLSEFDLSELEVGDDAGDECGTRVLCLHCLGCGASGIGSNSLLGTRDHNMPNPKGLDRHISSGGC